MYSRFVSRENLHNTNVQAYFCFKVYKSQFQAFIQHTDTNLDLIAIFISYSRLLRNEQRGKGVLLYLMQSLLYKTLLKNTQQLSQTKQNKKFNDLWQHHPALLHHP